jgi:hypothetical protein
MKRVLSFAAIVIVLVVFLGCSSTYTIRTKDGKEYVSQGEPDLTDDKFIKFETTAGRKVLIKQDEISTIQEN